MIKMAVKVVTYDIPVFIGNADNTDLQLTTPRQARLT
jgi:hypothetical protein